MNLHGKTRILLVVWNFAALLFVTAIVLAFFPGSAAFLTREHAFYGDMFNISQVRIFKQPIALNPTTSATQLRDAEVIVIGDSFMNASLESPKFAYLLEDALERPTWYVKQNPHYMIKPSLFFEQNKKSRHADVLVWEQVERNILGNYHHDASQAEVDIEALIPARVKATSAYARYTRVRDVAFRTDPVLFLVTHARVTRPIFEQLATTRFAVTGDISPRTPEVSLDPVMGFYDVELYAARRALSDADIAVIADAIAEEIRRVEKRGVSVVYLPLPSKYTVYRSLLKNQEYNELLPRLVPALRERGVSVVDVLPRYEQHVRDGGKLLYHCCDTHWVAPAKKIAAEEVRRAMRQALDILEERP